MAKPNQKTTPAAPAKAAAPAPTAPAAQPQAAAPKQAAAAPATKPAQAPAPQAATASGPTHEQISRRAYEIYQARGGQHGRHHDDWVQAERELKLGKQ